MQVALPLRPPLSQPMHKKAQMLQCVVSGPVDSGYRWVTVMVCLRSCTNTKRHTHMSHEEVCVGLPAFMWISRNLGGLNLNNKHQYRIHKGPDAKQQNVSTCEETGTSFSLCVKTHYLMHLFYKTVADFQRSSINLQFQCRRCIKNRKSSSVPKRDALNSNNK